MEIGRKKLTAIVEIEYSQFDRFEHLTKTEAEEIVLNLAFKPNFNSMENGVFLDKVEVRVPEEENPSRVYGYGDYSIQKFFVAHDRQ